MTGPGRPYGQYAELQQFQIQKNGQMRLTSVISSMNKHLTIFFTFFFSFLQQVHCVLRPKRDPKKAGRGGGGKKEGEGPRFFPADRTPDIVFRSLFGFGTVEFGIAGRGGDIGKIISRILSF
jgi:hypothetical protein